MLGQGIQRKRWTEQLGLGNGKVMGLKIIKHDEALFVGAKGNENDAPERLSGTLIERRGWIVDHGQATHELKKNLK